MNILLITSSPRGEAAVSTRIARSIAHRLLRAHPGASITERDLNRDPVPFIGPDFVRAIGIPEESRSEADRRALRASDALTAELLRADVLVIGAGMINFAVPAALKAWIDQVTRAGLTFSYAGGRPEGLLRGKKAYLALASGSVYSDGPAAAMDFQRPYLEAVLGFLGITDVEVVLAEGTKLGPGAEESALAQAAQQVARIAVEARQPALV